MPFQASSLAMVQSTPICSTSPAWTQGRESPRAWAARTFCVSVIGRRWLMAPQFMLETRAPRERSRRKVARSGGPRRRALRGPTEVHRRAQAARPVPRWRRARCEFAPQPAAPALGLICRAMHEAAWFERLSALDATFLHLE